jgi:hypothetical protein
VKLKKPTWVVYELLRQIGVKEAKGRAGTVRSTQRSSNTL